MRLLPSVLILIFFIAFEQVSAQRLPPPPPPNFHYNNYYRSSGYTKHEFTIVFRDSTTMTVKTMIDTKDSIQCIKWGRGKNKIAIRPSETKEIYRLENGDKIIGIPMDSCWAFPAGTGRINTYSTNSETDQKSIAYIQKGLSAPLLPLTEDNLREMVKDSPEALKLVDRKKLFRAIEKYNE